MRFLFFLFLFFPLPTMAALPIVVATTFKDLIIDFGLLLALAWPLIALIVASFWIIKAFKRIVFSV